MKILLKGLLSGYLFLLRKEATHTDWLQALAGKVGEDFATAKCGNVFGTLLKGWDKSYKKKDK